MFDHKHYQAQFLTDYKEGRFYNNSVAYVARATATPKFTIIGIHHLTPDENVGKHNLYMDIVDINGVRQHSKIDWGWNGQRSDELVNPVVLDKPPSEPSGNIAMGTGQVVWAKVLNQNSDIISGVTTLLPDEGQGNTIGHHSYYVVWLWTEGDTPPDEGWEKRYNTLLKKHNALIDKLKALAGGL